MDASRFAVWRLVRKWPSRGDSWCNHCSANMDSQGRGELVWSNVKLGRRAELQVRQYSPSVKNKLIVALNRHLGKICRVFSLNAHVMMCQLFHQEDNWGALCHWKDLWQEETVRIVTQRLASRAKQLPEATYANDRWVYSKWIYSDDNFGKVRISLDNKFINIINECRKYSNQICMIL